ncbi:carbohydrate sulfotransferase 15-like [Amphibalanus amphitrite]|uniref:carbohydrate sulfotransferase 15-like n=1 Tax=Amphibalanus amphitrite TaxID=1232801 RepID=UPI001C911B12|nr:carbohydrate sulfotransferase 15-like [Amphibalanus amphitrite]
MNDLKIPPHGVDIRAGSGLISSLSGTASRLCRVSAIGRRSLLVTLGLTLLLLYCANSPPIPRQKGWPERRPTEVVLVTGHGFGGEPTFCVRRLSAAVSFQSDPADPQIGFLPGVQNHCWLQELRPEDFDYLRNNDVQRKDKNVFIKLHKRAELYASYARRPPGGVTAVRVRCLPFVYVIGQPKCGTTDLRHRLSLHPRVASGTVWSDAHWWSRQRFPAPSGDVSDRPSGPVSFREYLDSFELVSHRLVGADCGRTGDGRHRPWTPDSRIITVDGSTSTMWDERSLREARRRPALAAEQYPPLAETTAAGLAALQPTARIVAILREPTDRLFSDYLYFNSQRDSEKSADEFHQMAQRAVGMWTNCTRSRTENDCATDRRVIDRLGVRLHVGLYAVYLRPWLQEFGRDQVLVLRTEDHRRNITQSLHALFNHLDIGVPADTVWEEIRTASPKNVRRKSLKHQTMLPETRGLLRDFYRPFNRRLARLLRSERFLWEDSEP